MRMTAVFRWRQCPACGALAIVFLPREAVAYHPFARGLNDGDGEAVLRKLAQRSGAQFIDGREPMPYKCAQCGAVVSASADEADSCIPDWPMWLTDKGEMVCPMDEKTAYWWLDENVELMPRDEEEDGE